MKAGWHTKRLDQLVELCYGKALKAEDRPTDGQFPVYGSNGIVGTSHTALVEHPTIVIGRKGAVGEAHLAERGCWPIDTTFFTRPRKENQFHLRYLLLWLRSIDLKHLAITATVPGINRDTLNAQQVPVPPLAEQKRIVCILDEAAELRKLRAQADRRTADLIPAFFHEMFGDPVTNPKGWSLATLGDIGGHGQYGLNAAAMTEGSGVRFIRITDIDETGQLGRCAPAYVPRDTPNLEEYELVDGDILIARSGATAGKSYMHTPLDEISVFAGYLIRFKVNLSKTLPVYVFSFLRTESYWAQLNSHKRAVAQPNVNAKQLASIRLPIPPISLQREFAARVAEVRAMEAQQAASRRRLDELFQSLLHRAFRGEL